MKKSIKYLLIYTVTITGSLRWKLMTGELRCSSIGWEGDFTTYPFISLEFYFVQKIKYKQFTNYPTIYFHIIKV